MSVNARMTAVAAAAAVLLALLAGQQVRAAQSGARVDEDIERELVRLANEERAQAGVPALEVDGRITATAREHARRMAERNELAHQFPGESPLMERLAQSEVRFDAAAENVSSSESAAESHAGIMRSPPHRRNLLNPRYNTVGVGVVRRGSLIFVTQNFVHKLPERTVSQAEEVIAVGFNRERRRHKLRPLSARRSEELRGAACEMAGADKPSARAAPTDQRRRRTVVAYTATSPEQLPEPMEKMARDGDIRGYSLGACFARSASYPSGTFWVLAVFDF